MDITKAIRWIHPTATGWTLRGDDYEGLDWFDATHAKPSLGELQGAWAAIVSGTFVEQRKVEIAAYIELREKMCARVAGIAGRLARGGDTASATSCDAVVVALLDVLNHPTVTGATDIAAFKLAIKTRYLTAVAGATTAARNEFKLYDK